MDKKSEETKSVKGGKMSEAVDSSNKKISSVLTEDTKLGDENIKLKV